MEEIILQTLIRGVGLPLAAAIAVTGILRFALGADVGRAVAGGAIAIAFLASFAAVQSWPDFPPRSSGQKLPYIVLFGVVIGLALDALRAETFRAAAVVVWPAVIVGWIGWRQLTGLGAADLATLAVVFAAGVIILHRLHAHREGPPFAAVTILAASVGTAAIAFMGGAASIALVLGILAAATGGFLLWNWPKPRMPFGAAALMGAGGAYVTIFTTGILFTETSRIALALMALVFLVPLTMRNFRMVNRPAIGPLVIGAVSIVPVAIGVAIAFEPGGGSTSNF